MTENRISATTHMRTFGIQIRKQPKGLLRKHFDLLRNSHSTVPVYADECELLVFGAFLNSPSACRKGFFDTLRRLIAAPTRNFAPHAVGADMIRPVQALPAAQKCRHYRLRKKAVREMFSLPVFGFLLNSPEFSMLGIIYFFFPFCDCSLFVYYILFV